MKLSRPGAGLVLPLFPALLIGALAATGSGRALFAGAAQVGRGGAARLVEADAAAAGLPWGAGGVQVAEDVVLHDGRRGRDVPVTVLSPRSGRGPFPVIVFSHGAGGDGDQNQPLTRYWASHGYVVLCPTHADSLALQRRLSEQAGGTGIATPSEAQAADGDSGDGPATPVGDGRASTRETGRWFDRAQDVSFLIDSLPELEQRVPGLAGRVDTARVGVGGESWLGAATAQIVGGVAFQASAPVGARFGRDPRALSVLLLTSHGNDCLGVPEGLWPTIPRSLLAITGPDVPSRRAARVPAGALAAAAHRCRHHPHVHVRIQAAFPLTFGGDAQSAAGGPGRAGLFSYVEDATLTFWDATLKGAAAPQGDFGARAVASARAHGVIASAEGG